MPRKNGIIAYPAKLVAAITRFVVGAMASSPGYQRVARSRLAFDPTDPLGLRIQQDAAFFVKLRLRQQRTEWGSAYEATIKTDFKGMEDRYPVDKMQEHNPTVRFVLVTKPNKRAAGALGALLPYRQALGREHPDRINTIMLNLPANVSSVERYKPTQSLEGYEEAIEFIRDTLRHEMRHFVQYSLGDALGFERTDVTPAQRAARDLIGLGGYDAKTQKKARDGLLSFIEYFPWMGDWFNLTRRYVDERNRTRRKPRPMVLADFDAMLTEPSGVSELIKSYRDSLKAHAPDRYRRLLQEQAVFLGDYNDALREKGPKRKLTPQRAVSELLMDLDIADSALAAYTRKNREHFIAFARSHL